MSYMDIYKKWCTGRDHDLKGYGWCRKDPEHDE